MEPRKLRKPIDYSSGMCLENFKLSECITYGVCKTTFHNDFYSCSGAYTHSQTLNVFVFIFLVYLPFHIWPNWFSTVYILQFAVNEVASMAAILVTFVTVILKKKKKIPGSGYKESLFVLNHLIHIFSIYMYCIYIYMITFFGTVGQYVLFGLRKGHCRWVKILGWLRPWLGSFCVCAQAMRDDVTM